MEHSVHVGLLSHIRAEAENLSSDSDEHLVRSCGVSAILAKPRNVSTYLLTYLNVNANEQVRITEEKLRKRTSLFVACSMGSPELWSFDDVVTKKYGCQDMAYDPT